MRNDMTTPEERIAQQIAAAEQKAKEHAKKVRQLKAQQQAMEARKLSGLLKGQRADDTRRKILLGAMTQEMMNEGLEAKQRIMARLDKYLTRPDDRALFDLPATKSQP